MRWRKKTKEPEEAQELEKTAEVLETPAAEQPETAATPETPAAEAALPYDRLAQAGINVELGLDYCAGEDSFYREMLRIFYDQSAAKREELISLYESENWKDYAIKAHALKSTSLTIGAEQLSAQAKELELAGKRGDTDYIRAHHAEVMQAYEELCSYFAGI